MAEQSAKKYVSHYLIPRTRPAMLGLHHRACDPNIVCVTRGRNKKQGSFIMLHVTCGNCKRTTVYKRRMKEFDQKHDPYFN